MFSLSESNVRCPNQMVAVRLPSYSVLFQSVAVVPSVVLLHHLDTPAVECDDTNMRLQHGAVVVMATMMYDTCQHRIQRLIQNHATCEGFALK